MAEPKTFSLLANVCKCFNVKKSAFSCWSRAWNKYALNSLNINRDTLQQSQANTAWSKHGPLSTVLRSTSESLKLTEKKRFEVSKVAGQQKKSGDQVLKKHLQEKQSEQQRPARPYVARKPLEAEGGIRQRLMDLMRPNLAQKEPPLLGYDDLNLASKYARFVESQEYEDYPAQRKPKRRLRNVCASGEERKQISYRQEYVWNRKPPMEYTTLPESGWIRDQQSLKEQQRLKEQQESLKDQKNLKEQQRLKEQQLKEQQRLKEAEYIEISGIKDKILRNDRIMQCIRTVESNAHIPIDFKPQTYRHGFHWHLKKSQSDLKLQFGQIPEIPKMQQPHPEQRSKAMPEAKDPRKVTKKQLKDQKVPKPQEKVSDYEYIPSHRTVSEMKSMNKAKNLKKFKIGSKSEKSSKRFPRRG